MKITDRDDARAAITLVAELFPRCFFVYEGRRRPLKIGIRDDIAARVDDAIAQRELAFALGRYCRATGYLRSLRAGAMRIDLDGAVAGDVTPVQAAFAAAELGRHLARIASRKQQPLQKQEVAAAPKQEVVAAPKRPGRPETAGVEPEAKRNDGP